MVKNGCGHSVHGTIKLAVSQEEINSKLICWCIDKNSGKRWKLLRWCGLLGHVGSLKSSVSQEWINEMNWFFAHWYKFRKVKSYYWVDMVKNGQGLIDHGTLQSGVSDKLFNELSRLTEQFVDADSDGSSNFWFDCQSTFYVWHWNAVGPLQLYLATFFHKNSLQAKAKKKKDQNWPRNKVFPLFWKFLQLIFAASGL